ncbi:aldose 1-epimerase family protein [Demequina rhizosphaerae]|uniref:aldose 1-epimerase family protein n=1 Tax=Demequina rhizosphaerae TaxID=1638985 RepID=UPI000780B612|nr:aldose 1-epimerase family protein [Demequina rhizosphaerae]
MTDPVRATSGRQHAITAGGYRASLASMGASLRALTHHGRDLVVSFDADEERPAMRGALLAPWPNRTAGGRYSFDGRTHLLAIDEPARRTANHGLVADLDFALRERAHSRVVLGAVLEPSHGYPWRLDVQVEVAVTADGLAHTVVARNESATPAPLGLGAHPYLIAGPPRPHAVDAWTLEIPAARVMLVTPDRLLPDRIVEVAAHDGGALDFRAPRAIGACELNHAFTALRRDADGFARLRLTSPTGAGVELAVDGAYRWVQAYSSDEVEDGRPRTGLALEPMTCPPDALNSKHDLIVLDPGEVATAAFRLRAIGTR